MLSSILLPIIFPVLAAADVNMEARKMAADPHGLLAFFGGQPQRTIPQVGPASPAASLVLLDRQIRQFPDSLAWAVDMRSYILSRAKSTMTYFPSLRRGTEKLQ